MIQDGLASTVQFTDRMMCGVGGTLQRVVDACFGDSGGPLVRQVVRQYMQYVFSFSVSLFK